MWSVAAIVCVLAAAGVNAALLDSIPLHRVCFLDEHQAGVFGIIASSPVELCDLTKDYSKNVSQVNIYWYSPHSDTGTKYSIHEASARLSREKSFNKLLQFIFIYPGFNTNHSDFAPLFLKGYQRLRSKINMIFIDHYAYTHSSFIEFESYRITINYMHSIAYSAAQFVKDMVQNGVRAETIHVVGHSYGAQSSGVLGQYYYQLTGNKLPRCTGLDPCGPCLNRAPDYFKLNSGDFCFVDCVHTNEGQMGTSNKNCDVDFYPNGNFSTQPGCGIKGDLLKSNATTMACSHLRALTLWLETVDNIDSCYARECKNWRKFQSGECSNCRVVRSGLATPVDVKGSYIYRTRDSPDYMLGLNGTLPSPKCEKSALSSPSNVGVAGL